MTIPIELVELIDRLTTEIETINQLSSRGSIQVKALVNQFPDNQLLLSFFAYFSNCLMLVETYDNRVTLTKIQLQSALIPNEDIQEAGQDLSAMLGVVLEVKLQLSQLINRLEDLR